MQVPMMQQPFAIFIIMRSFVAVFYTTSICTATLRTNLSFSEVAHDQRDATPLFPQ
jgi:hypothetical protein